MAKKRKKEPAKVKEKDQSKFQAKNDAYTGMLTLSLFALLGGCVLLYLDFSQYGDKAPTVQKVQLIDAEQDALDDGNPLTGAADPNANPGGANPAPNPGGANPAPMP